MVKFNTDAPVNYEELRDLYAFKFNDDMLEASVSFINKVAHEAIKKAAVDEYKRKNGEVVNAVDN